MDISLVNKYVMKNSVNLRIHLLIIIDNSYIIKINQKGLVSLGIILKGGTLHWMNCMKE